MKVLQWLAALAFVVAGIALLCAPASGQVASAAKAATFQSGNDGGTEVSPLQGAVVAAKAFVPSRFTVVDAGTVGKLDMVLIPGLASSRRVWDGEAKLLAPNYRLHLVQIDGFAGAPAGANAAGPILPGVVEELHGYIGTLGGVKPVVMGHSLGGLLALMLADKYPGDVSRLVIVDSLPYYAVLFNPAATVETMKPQAEVIKSQMITMPKEQYEMMVPMMVTQMVKDPEAQKKVAVDSTTSDREVASEAMYEDLETDLRGEVGKITTPTLVVFAVDAGTKQPDPVQYEATVRAAYKAMPHVTLVKVEESRHFLMYDQPEKFDAVVEGWLR